MDDLGKPVGCDKRWCDRVPAIARYRASSTLARQSAPDWWRSRMVTLRRTSVPSIQMDVIPSALERVLAERIRASDQKCEGFLKGFIEHVVPTSQAPNWAVKGVKYGKAERDKCHAAITRCIEESQLEFEISDWKLLLSVVQPGSFVNSTNYL